MWTEFYLFSVYVFVFRYFEQMDPSELKTLLLSHFITTPSLDYVTMGKIATTSRLTDIERNKNLILRVLDGVFETYGLEIQIEIAYVIYECISF